MSALPTHDDPALRCTGRTTRLLLEALLTASQSPNEWVSVRNECDTYVLHLTLAKRCQEVAAYMGLNVDIKRNGDDPAIRLIV